MARQIKKKSVHKGDGSLCVLFNDHGVGLMIILENKIW